MTVGGYDAFDDPYAYKGISVLKNRLKTRDAAVLAAFEMEMTALRAEEPLPRGRFGPAHYCAVHRHLFQDVYRWAGRYRTVRTAKDGNWFCFPENIPREMDRWPDRSTACAFRPRPESASGDDVRGGVSGSPPPSCA